MNDNVNDLSKEELQKTSEDRIKRCMPVAKKVLKEMVKQDLLMRDVSYVQQVALQQMETMFKNLTYIHFNTIFQLIQDSLQISIDQANEKLWGKEKDKVKLKDIDKVLKAK